MLACVYVAKYADVYKDALTRKNFFLGQMYLYFIYTVFQVLKFPTWM